jgi:hypothetical protein
MRPGVLTGWIALAMLILSPIARAAQPDPVQLFKIAQAAQKQGQELQQRMIPLFDRKQPSHPATDLLALKIEHGGLVLRTPLPSSPMGSTTRVKIGDDQDWSLLTIQGGAPDHGRPVVPAFFSIVRMSFFTNRTETLVMQQGAGTFLNFSLQESIPTGIRSVQLQEQFPNRLANMTGGCQLVVMEMKTGQPWTPTIWNSDNFAALTLEHPLEVERYLRPLLHQLDQDAVMSPDEMLAFELFFDQWTADPGTTAKVDALITQLTGGDFHSRIRARHQLADLGKDGALALVHLDRSKLDPEQNARIDKVLTPYLPVPQSEAAKLGSNPIFLTNCLYSEDITIRKAALAHLQAIVKEPLTFDVNADAASRAKAIAALMQQLQTAKAVGTK